MIQATVQVSHADDARTVRRRIYQLVSRLADDAIVAASAAAQFSDLARAVLPAGGFSVDLCCEGDTLAADFTVALALTPAQLARPGLTGLLWGQGYRLDSRAAEGRSGEARKAWRIAYGRAGAPPRAELAAILESRTRDELFSEVTRQRKSLQEILDNAPLAVTFSVDRTLHYVNHACAAAFGLRAGESMRQLFADADSRAHVESLMEEQGFARGVEVPVHRASGELASCLVTVLPVQYDGRSGWMTWIIDITEQKRAQQAIEQARQAAEDATRAKSDFLANMSHEIRTPMNAIIGMAHLALRTELEPRQRHYVERVHGAGEALLRIINDILDFSKIEARRLELECTEFRLDDVLEGIANLVGLRAREKGLELLFDVADDVPERLIGDPLRLSQVLVNLAGNAVKFTEAGQVVVRVRRAEVAAEPGRLYLAVQDSGVGLTEPQRQGLFQSFQQADSSTTRRYGGTGLGLAISKSLVELMDGRIWVDSEFGAGSTFHFEVRLQVPEPAVDAAKNPAETVSPLQGRRALVIDDNPVAREVLAGMLRQMGAVVTESGGAREDLASLARQDLDLVLLDWRAPAPAGPEFVQGLASPPWTDRLIIVSTVDSQIAMDESEAAGLHGAPILSKPVTRTRLKTALSQRLQVVWPGQPVHVVRSTAVPRFDGLRVLVVEDNLMNQELAVELLEQAGVTVVVAAHGRQALDLLATDADFDGVLMDCQMPVMDGYEATRAMRARPELASLPVVAMTANALSGDRQKALDAGMQDHVPKPIDVDGLYESVRRWMPRRRDRSVTIATGAGAQATDAVTTGDGLPGLPGIDTADGLARALGKPAFYRKMLARFAELADGFGASYEQALASPDRQAAQRCAHTLRGSAGQVGARRVQAAAQALEDAIRQADGASAGLEGPLADLMQALAEVAPGLRGFLPPPAALPQAAVAAAAVPSPLRPAWIELRRLLEDGDSDAAAHLQQLLADAAAQPFAGALGRIARDLEGFDFDAALERLDREWPLDGPLAAPAVDAG